LFILIPVEQITLEQILELRKETVCPYDYAEKIQDKLKKIYLDAYTPKHSAEEYLKLIMDHDIGRIEEMHPQAGGNYTNCIYTTFCVASQHVNGFTKEHVLDQIWDIVNDDTRQNFGGVMVPKGHWAYNEKLN